MPRRDNWTEQASKSRSLFFVLFSFLTAGVAFGQGGPPYYTNDPGSPGNFDWEINIGSGDPAVYGRTRPRGERAEANLFLGYFGVQLLLPPKSYK